MTFASATSKISKSELLGTRPFPHAPGNPTHGDVFFLMGVSLVGTKTTRAKPLSNRKIIRRYGDKLRWLATSIPFSQGP